MDVYHVVFACPDSGKAVPTGVELHDIEQFASVGRRPLACACRHCGSWHVWSRHDAWLERHDPQRHPTLTLVKWRGES